MKRIALALTLVSLFLLTAWVARFLEPRACISSMVVEEMYIGDSHGCSLNNLESLNFKARIEKLDQVFRFLSPGPSFKLFILESAPFVGRVEGRVVVMGLERARALGGVEKFLINSALSDRSEVLKNKPYLRKTVAEFLWTVINENWEHEDPYSRLLVEPHKLPASDLSYRVSQALWKDYLKLSPVEKSSFMGEARDLNKFSQKVARYAQDVVSVATQKEVDLLVVKTDDQDFPWFHWSSMLDMGRRVYISDLEKSIPDGVEPKVVALVGCNLPKSESILKYQKYVKRAVFVKHCGQQPKINWWTLVNQGLESFVQENRDIEFVEFHLSSLEFAKELKPKASALSDIRSWSKFLSWQKVKWDKELNAYRPWGPVDGVTLFRLAQFSESTL